MASPVGAEMIVDAINGASFQLATAQTIAANSSAASRTITAAGTYLLDVQIAGTSVRLQSLGADGTTWRDGPLISASGTTSVVIGRNAQVRLTNPNGSAITVSASLS